jgi:hypothetical protein
MSGATPLLPLHAFNVDRDKFNCTYRRRSHNLRLFRKIPEEADINDGELRAE